MDYYEKKKIRSVLQGLKKQKSRDDIQRKRGMDWGRQFSTEQLNNMRNSLESVIALQFIRTYNYDKHKRGEGLFCEMCFVDETIRFTASSSQFLREHFL